MKPKLKFHFEGDKLIIHGLPSHFQLRKIKHSSPSIAELKHLSVASANMTAAKFYMDSTTTATKRTDPHMYDAALLAAIVKYASIFKPDSKGRKIDAGQIFSTRVVIKNASFFKTAVVLEDPEREFFKDHQRLIALRDRMIAHDDRIVGYTECFAALDGNFRCEHVIALTQRTTVFSAIKPALQKLPICIDIALTWLSNEKERHCQIVTDEINRLDLRKRRRFPAPLLERYVGLADADERKARRDPYWEYDWSTGKKRLVNPDIGLKPVLRRGLLSILRMLR